MVESRADPGGVTGPGTRHLATFVSTGAIKLDHYLRAVDRKTAKQYWKIGPPSAPKNVVRKKALNALPQSTSAPP
jgi:hypothetical protein